MPTSTSILSHVHETVEAVADVEMSPPHDPRTETPAYRRAHQFLVRTKKQPCAVCGVTIDTVRTPDTIETHHYPIERSLMNACDPRKVHARFPQVYDKRTLRTFIDSPANLITLCSTHHRSLTAGVHHLLAPDWAVLPFLRDGYVIAATAKDAAAVEAADEKIEEASAA